MMEEDLQKEILDELRKQTDMFRKHADMSKKVNIAMSILLSVFVVLMVISIIARPYIERKINANNALSQKTDSWYEARNLQDQGDIQKAREMTLRLIKKHPDYYYGYEVLGTLYQEDGNIKLAEQNYLKAYDLYPHEELLKTLTAIQKRMNKVKGNANQRVEQSR
jgi:tetratricopeptide (TPR) repeat protein